MIDKIKQLQISDLDKDNAISMIQNNEYGSEYLEDVLNICFLISPIFYNVSNKKYKENKVYQELIQHDNYKRSIAFKIILDKVMMKDSDITPSALNKLLISLCNYKIINMKVSIDKYKLYADTIASINVNAIEWANYILTSDSVLKLSNKEYKKIIDKIKIVTANNKDGVNTFDDNGYWDIRKSDNEQIKAYRKVLNKK
jgi:hypothetical protein